jgi:hypothetical protein
MKVRDVARHMQQITGMSFLAGVAAREDGQTRVE